MTLGYPPANAAWSQPRMRPPSASSAETFILLALILQVIGGALVIGGIAYLFGFSILFPYPYAWAALTAAAVVAVVVVVFLYIAYTYSYERTRRGEYAEAQTPTLVLGILSLFLGIVPGIFYLIGYVKFSDAVREQQAPVPAYGYPATGAATSVACRTCGRVYPIGAYAYCPGCGQKMGT